ncbi:MAG: hypothetical protein ACR2NM_12545 [Bythopirellula sp.]
MYVVCRPQHQAILFVVVACLPGRLCADAIVMTRAMEASTIAEIFVDAEAVRVELEIGSADLLHFSDLLPDAVRARLFADEETSSQQQLENFFRDGLVIRADEGAPIVGQLQRLAVRRRIVRDEITGEPLAEQPPDADRIVFASLRYQLPTPQPKVLTIRPPSQPTPSSGSANIGFVTYHHGLPVNDFRYLSLEAKLDLNWDDPWYSRFRHPNLQRQYAAPMAAYLYVEPFEVRKEIIVRPKDLEQWIDLGLDRRDLIPIDRQAELKQRVATFLREKNPVRIDGQAAEGQLDRIHFIRRSLRRTGIIDPPEPLDLTSAVLGVIFVYPTAGLPQEVTMTWEIFGDRVQSLPAAAADEAGPLPATLTPTDPVLRWRNFLRHPTIPTLVSIAPPPSPPGISIPVVTLLCVVALLPVSGRVLRSHRLADSVMAKDALLCLAIVAIGVVAFPHARLAVATPFAQPRQLTDAEAKELLTGLLHNVYRAFDRRDPSLIYDQLSRSIAGDLLEQVYLDTRKSIEIENQGGLKINVSQVDVFELESIGQDRSGLNLRCRWRVSGSVGHWGHLHERTNAREANLKIAAVDGVWKIVDLDMINDD